MSKSKASVKSPRVAKPKDNDYSSFLERKSQLGTMDGFAPVFMPDFLFDFQKHLVEWATLKGRAAIFADCGLGKTPMQLVWAENIQRKTNKPVLVLTPLAVAHQTIAEGEKFGIGAHRSRHGENIRGIVVTNYERLNHFNPTDFSGCVCDESSILKSFDGVRRQEITEFMKKLPYRLLCTATASPNDYTELGTSSEALGELGYTDMLTRFFKNDQNTIRPMTYRHKGQDYAALREGAKWRFKGHAERLFWEWVNSFSRSVRRPSDLGFSDDGFVLPPLIEKDHMIDIDRPPDGMLFSLPAVGLREQRDERRRTIEDRCQEVAKLVKKDTAVIWCHLNDEADLLEKIVKGSKQVSGAHSEEEKEEIFIAFAKGQLKRIISKPKIGAWGLNWQHCHRVMTFPSHSWEQYYQAVRRCWRFGQTSPVQVDIITTEGEKSVLKNLQRKALAADKMFTNLVASMNEARSIERNTSYTQTAEVPTW